MPNDIHGILIIDNRTGASPVPTFRQAGIINNHADWYHDEDNIINHPERGQGRPGPYKMFQRLPVYIS